MSLASVQAFFAARQLDIPIIELEVSTATVAEAAAAHDVEPGRIAKTLAFRLNDGRDVILVARGDARIDNRKFKDAFHAKARFIKPEDLEAQVGHPMGGVCPFALPEGVAVYLDESLRRYDPVYPAAGAPNNAAMLTLTELERVTGGVWVDVCKSEEA